MIYFYSGKTPLSNKYLTLGTSIEPIGIIHLALVLVIITFTHFYSLSLVNELNDYLDKDGDYFE